MLKLGIRVREVERRLAKVRDICVTNREELFRELRRCYLNTVSVAKLPEDESDEEEEKADPKSYHYDEETGAQQEPLYIGEKLRVQINEYLTNETTLDESQRKRLQTIR